VALLSKIRTRISGQNLLSPLFCCEGFRTTRLMSFNRFIANEELKFSESLRVELEADGHR
jgi:hypothetical protein